MSENKKRLLSGKGHIGSFCPHCGELLEFQKWDVSGDSYWEEFQCENEGCKAAFVVFFKAVEWVEIES